MRKKFLIITLLVLLMVFALAPVMSLPVSAEKNAEESEVETADVQAPVTILNAEESEVETADVQPTATVFSDGFEGAWNWAAGDWDSRNGYDYWGLNTIYGQHTGNGAAWCAEVSDHPFGATKYDNYMRAGMYRLVSLSGYTGVTLTFWYWTSTEEDYDYLQIMYHPTGAAWTEGSWVKSAARFDGYHSWTQFSIGVPSTANAIGFYFYSDVSNVESGAMVDDVVLTGTPITVNTVLDFWFTPNPVVTGNPCTLSGTLKTTGGTSVNGKPIYVDYSTNGGVTWNYAFTLYTVAPGGTFGTSFTAPAPGTYLVRGRFLGDATYNPSSHTETLIIDPAAWGDYHFRLSPYTDVIHIKISGSVVYGVAEVPGSFSDAPLLGYIEGSTFYLFVDIPDGAYSTELSMMVGSTSTLSGNVYRTLDGTSWSGPIAFHLVSASSASASSATASVLASAVEPEAWPPTYHFRLSPWIDIVHLGVSGSVINGQDEAAGLYYNRPVLGYLSGSFFILGFDWPAGGYQLGIIRASTSTMTGYAYRTTNGKSYYSGPTITFVPV